jgi:hypothetical protein
VTASPGQASAVGCFDVGCGCALRALPAWAWGCSSQACSRAWASVCAAAGAVASTKVSNHPVNRPGLLYRKGCESISAWCCVPPDGQISGRLQICHLRAWPR